MDRIDQMELPTVHSLGKIVTRNADEKTALRAFDAYFLGELLRRSAPKNTSGLFDGGQAGRMYRDHLYQELARLIAEKGDFGIAGSLEGRLTSESDKANAPTEDHEEGS